MRLPVYLDNNATTPCDPRVMETMLPYFTHDFGNAASRHHSYGWIAEESVQFAREQVAALIGADPVEIVFTSGATESDNLALKGVYEAYASKGNHIITNVTEHKAVLDSCRHIAKHGGDITYLGVKKDGVIDIRELEAAIKPSTILIAVMYANNETGTIQPIRQISEIARKHGVLFFSDAVQAVGKIPVDVNRDGIDLMAFTSHKMYGPKGVGALYLRRRNPRVTVLAQLDGGGHERNRRSGTLNVPAIVGFGRACEIARQEIHTEAARLNVLRDKLENELMALGKVAVNGSREHRLPHVSNMSFQGINGNSLLVGLNKDLAVSSGSACSSASPEPSYVLKALGVEDGLAHASVRFSLGRFTTEAQIDYAIEHVSSLVVKLRDALKYQT